MADGAEEPSCFINEAIGSGDRLGLFGGLNGDGPMTLLKRLTNTRSALSITVSCSQKYGKRRMARYRFISGGSKASLLEPQKPTERASCE